MVEQLDGLEQEALAALAAVADEETLAVWRSDYLGRKGKVTEAVKALGTLSREERPAYGRFGGGL
jgi:phenylalanyl-tRNA synthetase alpha chain